MLFSLDWLKELTPYTGTTEELLRRFNLMSTEVEDHYRLVTADKLTVGHVLECEMHPNSDHLHICQVDVGSSSTLQIVCGAPNVEKGQKVIVALDGAVLPGNFKIKKSTIRGVESNGMICSLDELGIDHKYHQEDGIHVLDSLTTVGSDPLTALSFDDEVIELSLTPNRGDLLSMMGVAYDVAAMFELPLTFPDSFVWDEVKKNPLTVTSSTKKCLSYYARVIENVTITESPQWLKARLIASGIRPINTVVDITNYVMLETGQPLHAFDYDKLNSQTIHVRQASKGETILTLDDKLRELTEDDLVITDGNIPVALAGVMGGKNTEVDATTRTILLESAVFDRLSVRKTSKRLDLRSESSVRFERGLDPNRTMVAINRAAILLQMLANGSVLKGVASFETQDLVPLKTTLTLSQLKKVTGCGYSEASVAHTLERLRFPYTLENQSFDITIPTRRIDVKTYQDIIEEVVRISGYDQIPTTLFSSAIPGALTERQKIRRTIRSILSTMGLNETLTYTLTDKTVAAQFDTNSLPLITIVNPINESRRYLKHSLIPGLLEVVLYNKARKMDEIHLFELGKGYFESGEKELLSAAFMGDFDYSDWQNPNRELTFYTVKGIIEFLFDKLHVSKISYRVPSNPHPWLHPGISAEIFLDNQPIGWIGKLHPTVQKEKGLDDTYVVECSLTDLFDAIKPVTKAKEVSKFPSVVRDIAIVIDRTVSAESLISVIRKVAKNRLSDIRIFDVYTGEKIDPTKKSMALSMTFQDYQKTLSTEEIDALFSRIVKAIESELNGTLRA